MIAPLQNADCLFLSKENQAKVGYAALAVVEAGNLIKTAQAFLTAGYHLEDVSGLVTSDGAVSVYHFAHFDTPGRATVMVIAPLDTVQNAPPWVHRSPSVLKTPKSLVVLFFPLAFGTVLGDPALYAETPMTDRSAAAPVLLGYSRLLDGLNENVSQNPENPDAYAERAEVPAQSGKRRRICAA